MLVQKAFKFRIYPNTSQELILSKTFGCCRFLYNKMLEERKSVYELLKDDKDALYTHKYMTEKEYKTIYPFLKEVDSISLQSSRERLKTAFKNFFDGFKTGRYVEYPKFHSRKNKQSFTTKMTNGNLKIDFTHMKLKLPKMKNPIRFRDDRIFTGQIRNITVSRTKSGKYYASILIQNDVEIEEKKNIFIDKIEAFDMSAKQFLVSEKISYKNP